MKSCWIGIDLGTTNVKVTAFAEPEAGDRVLGTAYSPCPATADASGAVVQDPYRLLEALVTPLQSVVAQVRERSLSVEGLCFSGAMHTLLGVSGDGEPLHSILTWADTRAEPVAAELRRGSEAGELYSRTGTPVHAMSPLVKLRWIARDPSAPGRGAARWVSSKGFTLNFLTDQWREDVGIASASGLMNVHQRAWDSSALALAGISESQLGEITEGTEALALTGEAARRLGLPAGTPVYSGGSDGALANLGMGVNAPGAMALSLGTSGALRVTRDEVTLDPHGRLFCYVMDRKRYVVGGPINNAGATLAWVKNNLLAGALDEESLLTQAAEVPAGSQGLFFLPYLTGERAPRWEPGLTGTLHGLQVFHDHRHVARAALEGVAFQLKWILSLVEALPGAGAPKGPIQMGGGGTQSDLWVRILADVLRRPLSVHHRADVSCYGAVRMVQHAVCGRPYPGVEENPGAESNEPVAPGPACETYQRAYERFLALYRNLHESE